MAKIVLVWRIHPNTLRCDRLPELEVRRIHDKKTIPRRAEQLSLVEDLGVPQTKWPTMDRQGMVNIPA